MELADKKDETRMRRRMYREVKNFVSDVFNDKNRYEIVYVAGRRKRRLKLSEIEVLDIKYSYHIASVRFSYFESGKVKRIDFSQILRIIDSVTGEIVWANPRPPYVRIVGKDRKLIFERDGHKCVLCGKGGRLVVHHIEPRRGGDDFNNLVTLCEECRKKMHKVIWEKLPGGLLMTKIVTDPLKTRKLKEYIENLKRGR